MLYEALRYAAFPELEWRRGSLVSAGSDRSYEAVAKGARHPRASRGSAPGDAVVRCSWRMGIQWVLRMPLSADKLERAHDRCPYRGAVCELHGVNTDSVAAPIRDRVGAAVGQLVLAQLPGRRDRLESAGDRAVVEEEGTYRFSVVGFAESDSVDIVPGDELFSFDDASRKQGPDAAEATLWWPDLACVCADVNSKATPPDFPSNRKKLEAATEYRQMLDDIAEVATEAVLQGFAPASTVRKFDPERRPQLLYQQFAFLHARLMGAGERDLALVLNRPHRAWVDHEEHHLPGTPMRGGSRNIRALARSGPRVRAPASNPLPSLPARMTRSAAARRPLTRSRIGSLLSRCGAGASWHSTLRRCCPRKGSGPQGRSRVALTPRSR